MRRSRFALICKTLENEEKLEKEKFCTVVEIFVIRH